MPSSVSTITTHSTAPRFRNLTILDLMTGNPLGSGRPIERRPFLTTERVHCAPRSPLLVTGETAALFAFHDDGRYTRHGCTTHSRGVCSRERFGHGACRLRENGNVRPVMVVRIRKARPR